MRHPTVTQSLQDRTSKISEVNILIKESTMQRNPNRKPAGAKGSSGLRDRPRSLSNSRPTILVNEILEDSA